MNTAAEWRLALERVKEWGGRVVVVAECGSTMDVARAEPASSGGAEVCVVALSQTHGRGTHGRVWDHAIDSCGPLGVAMTVTFDARRVDQALLSLAVGVAVCEVANHFADDTKCFGVKWPNDVVLRADGRKLAGVLIERTGDALLVGVGLNVLHAREDYPAGERDKRCSLSQVGSQVSTLDAACALLSALALCTQGDVVARWRAMDVLVGTRRVFVYDNREYAGVVIALDPIGEIVVRLEDGTLKHLQAAGTRVAGGTPALHLL